MSGLVTLLTGGARCGKSRRALQLAAPYTRRVFVATSEPVDDEMAARIAGHRAERGAGWETIECPLDLDRAVASIDGPGTVAVLDCLTVWLGNAFHHWREETTIRAAIDRLADELRNPRADWIVVTNEVGWGIVPADAETRLYRDLAGYLNAAVARHAARVELLVAGIPLVIKGESL